MGSLDVQSASPSPNRTTIRDGSWFCQDRCSLYGRSTSRYVKAKYFVLIKVSQHFVAGSLGTSVFDPEVYLVGASGGVYALLAAHLANVVLNYNQMELGLLRIFGVFFVGKLKAMIDVVTSFNQLICFSECRCWFRDLWTLRQRRNGPNILCGTYNRSFGRAYLGLASFKKL